MKFIIEFKPRALKDLGSVAPANRKEIIQKIEALENNLAGDVKRLSQFTPEYRLRAGDYRILFEIDAGKVIIYRIRHRKEAYR